MAYGDNRKLVATDTFDTEIDSNWENGGGGWSVLIADGSGHIDGTNNADAAIRRNSEAFSNDQYSIGTIDTLTTNDDYGAASVRMQPGSDESAYIGYYQTEQNRYAIWETDSLLVNVELAFTSNSGAALSVFDTITLEVEGITIRMGTNEGSGDIQRTITTDTTLTSGDPGIVTFENTAGDVSFTAWAGGDIVPPTASTAPFIKLPARFSIPALLIPKRTPKSSQVMVDWSHPFSPKLNSCFIWDSLEPYDLAGNIPVDKVTIGGAELIIDQGFLYFDRTADNEIIINDTNERWEVLESFDASWAIMHVFRFDPNAPSSTNEYTLHMTVTGTAATVDIALDDFGMTLYDGQVHCLIATARLDITESYEVWLDGILVGEDVGVSSTEGKSSRVRYQSDVNRIETIIGDGDNTDLYIGGTSQLSTDRWQGHLYSFMSWKRHLCKGEAKQLSIDPYQILIPRP